MSFVVQKTKENTKTGMTELTLYLTRGDSLELGITCNITVDGEVVPITSLEDGDSIKFALRKEYGDESVLITKDLFYENNEWILFIEAIESKDLSFDDYVFDIQYTYTKNNRKYVNTFISGTLTIGEEVY